MHPTLSRDLSEEQYSVPLISSTDTVYQHMVRKRADTRQITCTERG